MKPYKISKIFVFLLISVLMLACKYEVTEFGFDASINGEVTSDIDGSPVFGDLNSNNLVVKLVGEGDQQPTQIRVAGDGSYQNLKLFPKMHKVWLEGPIVHSDTFFVELDDSNLSEQLDFNVTPLLTPIISSGAAEGSNINVNYSIVPSEGNELKKAFMYFSTVKYPTANTGSRSNVWTTKKVTLREPSGVATQEELDPGVYYIRIGAESVASKLINYSNQIEVVVQ